MVFSIILIIAAVVVAMVLVVIYKRRKVTSLESNVATFLIETNNAITELERLIIPSHCFSEIEFQTYQENYEKLYFDISAISQNRHFAECKLDTTSILQFKRYYETLSTLREKNNKDYRK